MPNFIMDFAKKRIDKGIRYFCKPNVSQKIFYCLFKINNAFVFGHEYRTYKLCNTMNYAIPIPLFEETYLIMHTNFGISKLQNDLEMGHEYKFYLIDPEELIWKDIDVITVINNVPSNIKEDIIFNMNYFIE